MFDTLESIIRAISSVQIACCLLPSIHEMHLFFMSLVQVALLE